MTDAIGRVDSANAQLQAEAGRDESRGLRTSLATVLVATACLTAASAAGASTQVGDSCVADNSPRKNPGPGCDRVRRCPDDAGGRRHHPLAGRGRRRHRDDPAMVEGPAAGRGSVAGRSSTKTSVCPRTTPSRPASRSKRATTSGWPPKVGSTSAAHRAARHRPRDGQPRKGVDSPVPDLPGEIGVPLSATLEPDADHDG